MGPGLAPPIFADEHKFDGTNWIAWSKFIRVAARMKGAFDYLDGSIKDPSAPAPTTSLTSTPAATGNTTSTKTSTTSVPLPSNEMPWDSLNPFTAEWNIRNAWAEVLLIYNIKNPIGLGIDIAGTAADA